MKITKSHLWASLLLMFGSAQASVVLEVAGNDTLATAQNLNGSSLSYELNADILNSTTFGHLTVDSLAGDNTFDWFTFELTSASRVIFDIDYGMSQGQSFDPYLRLYNSIGTIIAYDDDTNTSFGGTGSVHSYDSFLDVNLASGVYAIEVSRFVHSGVTGDYLLQMSLANNGSMAGSVAVPVPVPVPEPSIVALIGLGIFGLALSRRKLKK